MLDKKHVEILLPNRTSWDAVCLTIESILKRTDYPSFSLMVCDNSEGKGDGNRLEYLRGMAEAGRIKLIENVITDTMPSGRLKYGHGENIKVLLRQCRAPFAMLMSTGTEVVDSQWLRILMAMIHDENDLGVARLRKAENHFQNCWSAPRWIPNWMLLNMKAYAKIASDDLWDLRRIPYDEYWRKEQFDGMSPPAHPDPEPVQVFLDTGWRLWEVLEYENPSGLRMLEMPKYFLWRQFKTFLSLDRNAHRPEHEYVIQTKAAVSIRLLKLREEK